MAALDADRWTARADSSSSKLRRLGQGCVGPIASGRYSSPPVGWATLPFRPAAPGPGKDRATGQRILEIDVRGKRGVGFCKSMSGAVQPYERLLARQKPLSDDEKEASALIDFPSSSRRVPSASIKT